MFGLWMQLAATLHIQFWLSQMFNDKMLKIHVRRCVRTAIKLRKKYFGKVE